MKLHLNPGRGSERRYSGWRNALYAGMVGIYLLGGGCQTAKKFEGIVESPWYTQYQEAEPRDFPLTINSDPPRAMIFADEKYVGKTPLQAGLPQARRDISRYKIIIQRNEVLTGSSDMRKARLDVSPWIFLDWNEPTGPPIFHLKGHDQKTYVFKRVGESIGAEGRTSLGYYKVKYQISDVEREHVRFEDIPTNHTITARLEGYRTATKTVTVPNQDRVFLDLEWIPVRRLGTVVVDFNPDNVAYQLKGRPNTANTIPDINGQGDIGLELQFFEDENGRHFWDTQLTDSSPITIYYFADSEGFYPETGEFLAYPRIPPLKAFEVNLTKISKRRKIGAKGFKDFIGGREGLGNYAADLMATYLTEVDFLSMMERTQIERFFDERDLAEADIFDPEKRAEFALLGLDYLMLGTIRQDQGNYIATTRLVEAIEGISVISAMGEGSSPEQATEDLSEELISKAAKYFKRLDKEKQEQK